MKSAPFLILIFMFATSRSLASSELTLPEFLEKVKTQNLGLQVEFARAQAADAKSAGVAIPPPMVGYIQMNGDDGASASGFEVSQTIPFPSKLAHDHSARKLEAQAQNEMRLGFRQETLAKARLVYFSLWAAQERLSVLREKKSVIEQHIKLSRAAARSDSFLKIHVLKSESDFDVLENEILTSELLLKTVQGEAAELMNSSPGDFQPLVKEPPLTTLPFATEMDSSHQLEFAKLTLESARSRASEADASWFPEFSVRYKEIGESAMLPRNHEMTVGMTLPFIFFWEPRAASHDAEAQRLQAELGFDREKRKIEIEKSLLLAKAIALKKQIENLKNKILPRAEERMHLVHNIAPRDMESLQDHRETVEAFPDLKLKTLDLRMQYEEAVAGLEKYSAEGTRQ